MKKPSFTLAKSNESCTGAAMTLTLEPATANRPGYVTMIVAPQLTIGSTDRPAKFNDEYAAIVDLDFYDLAAILQVFRGECESLNSGHGIIKTGAGCVIRFDHRYDSEGYYQLTITDTHGGKPITFDVTSLEAVGLSVAFEMAVARCVFPNL